MSLRGETLADRKAKQLQIPFGDDRQKGESNSKGKSKGKDNSKDNSRSLRDDNQKSKGKSNSVDVSSTTASF